MKLSHVFFTPVFYLTALILLTGCGVNQKRLDTARLRIEELKKKGVPDSALTDAQVYLYRAEEAKKKRDNTEARIAADSVEIILARAESFYADNIAKLGPTVDSLVQIIKEESSDFTSYQKKRVDSTLAIIDSYVKMDWLLQAKQTCEDLLARMPEFKKNEKLAKQLGPKIVGTWVCVNKKTSKVNKMVNATQTLTFYFNRNGDVLYDEKESGQQKPTQKLSYHFKSYGTYAFDGDTIRLSIDRHVRKKEEARVLHLDKNKRKWEVEKKQPYDSAITDGSQDRSILYKDLIDDFKKVK